MKNLDLLLEEIFEDNETSQYQIYCDMDGVLVDFEPNTKNLINQTIKDVFKNLDELSQLTPDNKNPQYKRYKLTRKMVEKDLNGDWTARVDNLEGKKIRPLMYFLLERDKDFWSNLPWAPGGKELWDFIETYEPIILSSPVGKKSIIGKREWCQRELGLSGDRVIVVPDKGINIGTKIGILIDDRDKPLSQFNGIKIKYLTGQPQSAIRQLKDLGFE